MSTDIEKLTGWMTTNGERVQREMPDGYSVEKIKRVALHLGGKNSQLKNCSAASLWLGIIQAAHLGLSIDLGEAHLVPYGHEAVFQIDYKGLIKLAKRSGRVTHVKADVVRDGDTIEYRRGTDGASYLRHQPIPFNEAPIVGAYAIFTFADGTSDFETLSMADAKAIRAKASGGSMMWKEFEGEALKKAVIRRGLKTLELMPDDQRALVEDDRRGYDMQPVVATLNQRFAGQLPGKPQVKTIETEVTEEAAQ